MCITFFDMLKAKNHVIIVRLKHKFKKNKNTQMNTTETTTVSKKHKKYTWLLLFAIVICAFSVRFAKIETVPAGIYPDEAVNGTDAQEANATGSYKLFYESNNGREGLFINLQALSIKAFGPTQLGLLFWPVIFGTLTTLGMFFLNKELFGSARAGLIGSYLVAFSYWSINFSRIGFRAVMVPFLLVWSFYFMFKGLRTKKYADFIFAGLIFGLGVHTYIAFRVAPLVLIILFCALLFSRRHFLRNYWRQTLVFAISMFITALPMLLDFFVFHPEHYASRTSQISVLNPETNQGHLLPLITKTFAFSLAKYNFWGDQNWRHNYPPYPLLNPVAGISFLIGFFYVIFKFFRLAWLRLRRGIHDDKLHIYAFILAWFFALLIPEFLAYEGNPHALRAIGTLPVVFVITTIPFLWILGKAEKFGHFFKVMLFSVLTATFAFIGIFDTIKYLVFFANNPKQHQAFEANLVETSNYLRQISPDKEKFVITGSMQRVTIKYLNPQMPELTYFYPDEIDQINPQDKNFEIVFTDPNIEKINQLRDRFKNIIFEEHKNSFGDTYYVLKY